MAKATAVIERNQTEYELKRNHGQEYLSSAGRHVRPAPGCAVVKIVEIEMSGLLYVPNASRGTLSVEKGGKVSERPGASNEHLEIVEASPGYWLGSEFQKLDLQPGDRVILPPAPGVGVMAPAYYPPGVGIIKLQWVVAIERLPRATKH